MTTVLAGVTDGAYAAGGTLGIDTVVGGDARGIWSRNNQMLLQDIAPLLVLGTALWQGDGTRSGHTSWQSFDSFVVVTLASEGMKLAFSRARPSQTIGPNRWFQGAGHKSFPSGEVLEITTAVIPYVLGYEADHPSVWALELLPVYDSIARVKSHAHWQSDVLASFAIGTGIGYYFHSGSSSLSVSLLPKGATLGWKTAC